MADFNGNALLGTPQAAAQIHCDLLGVSAIESRGSSSAGAPSDTAAGWSATDSADKARAPEGASSSSSTNTTTTTSHQPSARAAGSTSSCSQASSSSPSSSPFTVKLSASPAPPAASSSSLSAPGAAAPLADTCAPFCPSPSIPSAAQGHMPACLNTSPGMHCDPSMQCRPSGPSLQCSPSGPSTHGSEQPLLPPRSMSSQTSSNPDGAKYCLHGGGLACDATVEVPMGEAPRNGSPHCILHPSTPAEGQSSPPNPLYPATPPTPHGWVQSAEVRPNAHGSILNSGAGIQGRGLHASVGLMRGQQGVGFGGNDGRGMGAGDAGCVRRGASSSSRDALHPWVEGSTRSSAEGVRRGWREEGGGEVHSKAEGVRKGWKEEGGKCGDAMGAGSGAQDLQAGEGAHSGAQHLQAGWGAHRGAQHLQSGGSAHGDAQQVQARAGAHSGIQHLQAGWGAHGGTCHLHGGSQHLQAGGDAHASSVAGGNSGSRADDAAVLRSAQLQTCHVTLEARCRVRALTCCVCTYRYGLVTTLLHEVQLFSFNQSSGHVQYSCAAGGLCSVCVTKVPAMVSAQHGNKMWVRRKNVLVLKSLPARIKKGVERSSRSASKGDLQLAQGMLRQRADRGGAVHGRRRRWYRSQGQGDPASPAGVAVCMWEPCSCKSAEVVEGNSEGCESMDDRRRLQAVLPHCCCSTQPAPSHLTLYHLKMHVPTDLPNQLPAASPLCMLAWHNGTEDVA
eukprot:1147663-Pelagomonas_calceolata.AAC.4